MSGLYLIGVIALWLWLTSLLWKGFKRLRARAGKHTTFINVFALLLALIWLGASFWYSGGRKIYYDRQVERLCAIDGGIKVYETVRLPAAEYEKYARRNWILPDKMQSQPSDNFYYEKENIDYRIGNPKVSRKQTQIVRRSDGAVLGEYVQYSRGGGDLPGLWHGSSFICPNPNDMEFESIVFSKGDE
jgi:hypothetical protein